MRSAVVASAKILHLRRIAGEVMAHSGEFDEPRTPRMKSIDDLDQVATLVGAGCWIGSAVNDQYRNVYLFPLLGQAEIPDLLHVRAGDARVAADHLPALFAQLDDCFRWLVQHVKMVRALLVGTDFGVYLVGRLPRQRALATDVFQPILKPASPDGLRCHDAAH